MAVRVAVALLLLPSIASAVSSVRAPSAFLARALPSAQQFLARNDFSAAAIEATCEEACGRKADASCVTECETQIYTCHNHNRTVVPEKFQKCYDETIKKAEEFRDPEVALLAHSASVPTAQEFLSHGKFSKEDAKVPCTEACPKDADSSCVTVCQVEVYQCHDHNQTVVPEKFQKCYDAAIDTAKKFPASTSKAVLFMLKAHDPCVDACGKGADSSCVPQCQVEYYECLDHNRTTAREEYDSCTQDVIIKYTGFKARWNASSPYGKFYLVNRNTNATSSRTSVASSSFATGPCKDSCGTKGVDSSCVPQCQVEMYACLDHDRVTERAEYDDCTLDVMIKYSGFRARWNATSPYGKF